MKNLQISYLWKLKDFLLKSGIRQGCPLLLLLFNIVSAILAKAVRLTHTHTHTHTHKVKSIQIRKEEVNLSLFADDMIYIDMDIYLYIYIYVKNPQIFSRKTVGAVK